MFRAGIFLPYSIHQGQPIPYYPLYLNPMNQTIRRGDYLEVDYVEPPPAVDDRRKKVTDEPNPNIYTENVSVNQIIQKLRIPIKNTTSDGYAISNIRDQLIQLRKEVEGKPKSEQTLAEINSMFLQLVNLQTLEKVEVQVKPFPQASSEESKFPPPKDYTLMLPFSTDIERRIKRLESLQYPYLILSELLVTILLGEKQQTFDSSRNAERAAQSASIVRNQDLINLTSRFQKLQPTINGFGSLAERMNKDQSMHSSAMGFIHSLQKVSNSHHEIQQQLNQSMALAQKLQQNWSENKAIFNGALKTLKGKLTLLKKK